MKPRPSLIPLALFALAFFGALLAFKEEARPIEPVLVTVTRTTRSVAPEAPPLALSSLAPAPVVRHEEELAEPSAEQPTERESLRLAAADDDEDVSARAQEAYEALIDRDDP